MPAATATIWRTSARTAASRCRTALAWASTYDWDLIRAQPHRAPRLRVAMQIIDPHHHLWDLERHDYPWLRPETPHPAGDLTPICRSYRLDDFLADAAGLELVKSVHLQAEIDRRDPVAETAWLQAIADAPGSRGFPHGIVAFADLADPRVEATLERHCGHANVRGIRYLLNYEAGEPLYCATERDDWLRDPQWRKGYAPAGQVRPVVRSADFLAADGRRAGPRARPSRIRRSFSTTPACRESATATMWRPGGTACARSPQRPMWPRKSRASACSTTTGRRS